MEDREKIQELIRKYHLDKLNDQDQLLLEQFIEQGVVSLEALKSIQSLYEQVEQMEVPVPSQQLDRQFYNMLEAEKDTQRSRLKLKDIFTWRTSWPQLAAATVLLLVGFGVGRYTNTKQPQSKDPGVEQLAKEVTGLKEMIMFSLLEKDAATERLKAVNLTKEMDGVSNKVTEALIRTLNRDDNVNVRLAALEALKPYIGDSKIRMELVQSISKQDSPLVQISLAELMAAIQERSSVQELQKILRDENTPEEIREKITESINVMI